MSDFKQDFYTVDEAAALFRVHVNTIYKLVKAKRVTVYKVGQQIRIPASELERLKIERQNKSN
jgi:excisionase family DNA binding protein